MLFQREEPSFKIYEPDAIARFKEAESTWRSFLLGQLPNPGHFQQHVLPLKAIEKIPNGAGNLSSNLNRYFMRTIDMDLIYGENTNYVYSKLGQFVIVGFVREDRPDHWKGTKVHVKRGRIEPRTYTTPRGLFGYMNDRAAFVAKGLSRLSPRQTEKIDKCVRENFDRYRNSDDFIAMGHDVRIFGSAAFTRKGVSEEESDKP